MWSGLPENMSHEKSIVDVVFIFGFFSFFIIIDPRKKEFMAISMTYELLPSFDSITKDNKDARFLNIFVEHIRV